MKTDIRTLLEKYWKAETSTEDERAIAAYFAQASELDEDLKDVQPLFTYFQNERSVKAPALSFIPPQEVRTKRIISMTRIWQAAAVFVLALSAVFLIRDANTVQSTGAHVVEIEDPEEALEYTKQALAMLSLNYNKGTSQMTRGLDKLDNVDILK